MAEHKKELSQLISVMSASVNRDLPARIEGTITREVSHLIHPSSVPSRMQACMLRISSAQPEAEPCLHAPRQEQAGAAGVRGSLQGHGQGLSHSETS